MPAVGMGLLLLRSNVGIQARSPATMIPPGKELKGYSASKLPACSTWSRLLSPGLTHEAQAVAHGAHLHEQDAVGGNAIGNDRQLIDARDNRRRQRELDRFRAVLPVATPVLAPVERPRVGNIAVGVHDLDDWIVAGHFGIVTKGERLREAVQLVPVSVKLPLRLLAICVITGCHAGFE